MCTAIALRGEDSFYFGRNMDIYYPLGFDTARIERGAPFSFSCGESVAACNAVIGTAVVVDGYPLYADGMNDKGLCMAGLEFPDLAFYSDAPVENKKSVSPYEFIPWVLTQCGTVDEVRTLLGKTHLINRPFSKELPLTPLHWMIADGKKSIAVETTVNGNFVYGCESNVLTNAPEYPFHAVNLRQYANLTADQPVTLEDKNSFGSPFSSGFGAIGLPGDFSSASRFVKAAFVAKNASMIIDGSDDGVSELIRALFSVAVPRGAVKVNDGRYNMTVYTSCMDVNGGKYYRIPYELSDCLEKCCFSFKN